MDKIPYTLSADYVITNDMTQNNSDGCEISLRRPLEEESSAGRKHAVITNVKR